MADTTLDVVTASGEAAGSVDLPAALFDAKTNIPLIHQVVVAQQAAARQGSIRAPQMTGGGIVHGPKPRDYSQRTPKKMVAAALLGALSDRARGERLHVVESFGIDGAPSTKAAATVLAALGATRRVLVVLDRADEVAAKSVRNIPFAHVLDWGQLNAYDVLVSDDIVFTKAAYDAFTAAKLRGAAASETTEEASA